MPNMAVVSCCCRRRLRDTTIRHDIIARLKCDQKLTDSQANLHAVPKPGVRGKKQKNLDVVQKNGRILQLFNSMIC